MSEPVVNPRPLWKGVASLTWNDLPDPEADVMVTTHVPASIQGLSVCKEKFSEEMLLSLGFVNIP
jgi:hypothetical protein